MEASAPAQGVDAVELVMELGHVSDPAAISARVADLRRETHLLDHQLGDALDAGPRFDADVEDVDALGGPLPDEEDGGDEVGDVKIRLILPAIAEDFEHVRPPPQLADEVVEDAVGSTTTDDIGEADDPGTQSIIGGETGEERLGGQLGGPVVRQRQQRTGVLL